MFNSAFYAQGRLIIRGTRGPPGAGTPGRRPARPRARTPRPGRTPGLKSESLAERGDTRAVAWSRYANNFVDFFATCIVYIAYNGILTRTHTQDNNTQYQALSLGARLATAAWRTEVGRERARGPPHGRGPLSLSLSSARPVPHSRQVGQASLGRAPPSTLRDTWRRDPIKEPAAS